MVKIKCRTNLDLLHEEWPTELPEVPRVGDYIESGTKRKGQKLCLKVYSVTWRSYDPWREWYAEVELNLRDGWTVTMLDEWYRNLES